MNELNTQRVLTTNEQVLEMELLILKILYIHP